MTATRRRRAFGQHFLKDQSVIDAIVRTTFEEVERSAAKALLEVGPGKGAITRALLEQVEKTPSLGRFLIVEKDTRLAEVFDEECKGRAGVEVVTADFLDVKAEVYLRDEPLVVVSNLPYSAGTAILQELAVYPGKIPAMILMFQAEVAARLRAKPREKAWGSLSLWIQNRWEVKKLLAVPPRAFIPPPDVNSEVVVLKAREKILVPPPEGASPEEIAHWNTNWEKLIRIPFLHRRKMLRSGLPQNSVWKEALEKAGIEGTRRAEELDWQDWTNWMHALHTLTFKFNDS
ncbi:MAG: ribosomal RNA small subunit methyltransferase A [Cryobacterium sp.]|nr:ribosomal RNA small subunit methyltransferase A [Oligoflexia bacterium]